LIGFVPQPLIGGDYAVATGRPALTELAPIGEAMGRSARVLLASFGKMLIYLRHIAKQ